MSKDDKIKVGISIGDINGIGIEVILKTFRDKRMLDFCTPILFGSTKVVSYYNTLLNSGVQLHSISNLSQITEGKINVMNVWDEDVALSPGQNNEVEVNIHFFP